MILARVKRSLVTCQELESRRLLSAGGNIDTSFGQNGYLNGYRAEALLGGSIIAQNFADGSQALASPDGKSVQPYSGPIPQQPPQNVQSDGKYLILANGGLTRFNPNGTVDHSFGNNGTVTDFGDGNPADVFTPLDVLVQGTAIYVVGSLEQIPNDIGREFQAVERLKPNGTLDTTFGTNGVAMGIGNIFPIDYSFSRIGPDGEIYTEWDMDETPTLIRFSPAGAVDGSFTFTLSAYFRDSVIGLQFEPDQKILVLACPFLTYQLFRLNHDMTLDSTFGQDGIVDIRPPFGALANVGELQGALLLRADGEIIVGAGILDGASDFTVAIKPDLPANSATVSGRFFNDVNGNRKQEKNEPGLAYWQAYADLNDNGIYDTGEPSGFADVTGAYSIHGLKPGTYIIREVRQDGRTRTTPSGAWPLGFYKVTVKANQTVAGLNFGNSNPNHAKGSISGTIFNDMNGDQIQDNGEPALSGWQAYIDVNDNGVHDPGEPIATADKNGHYTISGLVQGGYLIREIRHNGWSRTTPPGDWPLGFNEVSLAPGEKSTGNDFGNVHAASALVSISGKVIDDTNGNGKLDPGETGKAGVEVILYNANVETAGAPWLDTTTAADGSYSFANIAPGTYNLYLPDDGPTTDNFTLLPGQSFHQDFFDHQT